MRLTTLLGCACGLLVMAAIPNASLAGKQVTVCITSGSETSITPSTIQLTINGVNYGGASNITDWSIPAGNNKQCRTFTLVAGDAANVNDFHMQYSASGLLQQIDVDPLVQGQSYPLPGAPSPGNGAQAGAGSVTVTAAPPVPLMSVPGQIGTIAALLLVGAIVLIRSRRRRRMLEA